MNVDGLLRQVGLVACLIALPGAASGGGAAELPRAVLSAPALEVAAGRPVALTLKVYHDRGTRVVVPRLPVSWGPFHVEDQSVPITETTADGRLVTEETIVVSAYAPGTYATPPIAVTVEPDKGGAAVIETAGPINLTVVWSEEAPSCD